MERINKPAAFSSLAILIVACVLFGCDQQKAGSSGMQGSEQTRSESAVSIGSAQGDGTGVLGSDSIENVTLLEGDRQTFAEILQRNRGKVILVDFWATWCGPCVKQFPHSIQLSRKHRQDGLAVVSVSMNEPKEREAVLAFLRRQQADIDNLLPRYGAGSEFLEAFDLRGDVPFYKLYDRQGNLRYTFSGDPEGIENCEAIERIDQRVLELLEAKL